MTTPLPVQEPAGAAADEALRRMYALRDEVWKSARGSNDVDVGSAMQACREAIEALASLQPVTQAPPDVSIPGPGMNASGESVDSANVTQAKSEAVGDRDLALGLLCGLHPEITRDEPLEVAQQIFDHVQAERADHAREVKSLRQTIDELLRRSPAASAQAKSEAVAWQYRTDRDQSWCHCSIGVIEKYQRLGYELRPLYAAPQEAVERQPLTREQIEAIDDEVMKSPRDYCMKFARAIERHFGIGPATQEKQHG